MRRWKQLESEVIYHTKWLGVRKDQTLSPEGDELTYSYLDFNNGVTIIPVDSDGGIYFVEQHRYPPNKIFYELPGGHMESDNPIEDAKKELFEETGITAKVFKHLGKVYALPSHVKPYANVILAEDLDLAKLGIQQQENDEAISSVKKFSKGEILERMKDGSVCTGLNLSALMHYWVHIGRVY